MKSVHRHVVRLGAGALLAVVVAALAACTSSGQQPPAGNGSASQGLGTTSPETSPGGSGGGGGTAPPPVYPKDPETYAKLAVAAWAARDVARLDQLEVQGGSLHTMLSCNGCYEPHFVLVGQCDGAAGSSYCLFFNGAGDELRLRLVNSALGEPRAIGTGSIFDPITFPSNDQLYAEEALKAWQSRNDARLKLLTSHNLTSAAVDALGPDRASVWTFDLADGAAGSIYYTWRNAAGHKLTFRFTNGPQAPSTGPASQHRITDVLYSP